MSETIERVTGFVPSDLVGTFFGDVVTPETQAPAMASWAAAVADPTTVQQAQIELLRKGGGTVPVEVIAVGYTSPDGSFAGIPPVSKCAECHSAPMGETKAEAAFVAEPIVGATLGAVVLVVSGTLCLQALLRGSAVAPGAMPIIRGVSIKSRD